VFAGTQFRPSQVVLLLRRVCQRVSSSQLARELDISRQTVLSIRRKFTPQQHRCNLPVLYRMLRLKRMRCFKTQVKKAISTLILRIPRGVVAINGWEHGTCENDLPPIVGDPNGRESHLLQLRLAHRTDAATLSAHVHPFTLPVARGIQMGGVGILISSAPARLFCIK